MIFSFLSFCFCLFIVIKTLIRYCTVTCCDQQSTFKLSLRSLSATKSFAHSFCESAETLDD